MEIQVLAFGVAKDILGSSAIIVELPNRATTTELKSWLEGRYPRLKQLASYLLAVNSEYSTHDQQLYATDEIAIIPPVSGG